jgi:hypothetical protein
VQVIEDVYSHWALRNLSLKEFLEEKLLTTKAVSRILLFVGLEPTTSCRLQVDTEKMIMT